MNTKPNTKGLKKTPGPGRPKGAKNKLPINLRDKMLAIAAKLEAEGKGLEDEARKDPAWFYQNFLKPMLPKEIDLGVSEKIEKITIQFVKPDEDSSAVS